MGPEEKEAIIDNLFMTKRKGHKLEIALQFKGKGDEAAQIKKRTTKLAKKIDSLLASLMEEWMGSSAVTGSTLKTINRNLQKIIKDIKNDINVAKNVIKAFGYLDDAI